MIRLPVAALIVLGLTGGCVKQHTTLRPIPAPPNPQPMVGADVPTRVATLERLSDTYSRTSNELPGRDLAEHRKLMAQVFAQLEEILPLLEGPNPGAEFRQQIQVIRDAQAELSSGPADLSPEPTIDVGLRAARDVLTSIAQKEYYDQTKLTTLFDQLAAKINDLDTVRGPLHQLETGEAVGITSNIIREMTTALSQRLAAEQAPESKPSSKPATER